MVEYCISVLLSNFHGPSYSKINNIRADASDMLLSYGSSENKEEAKIILDSLSFDNHTIKTIYNKKENVHTSTINKTAINTITIIIEDVNKMFQEKIFGFLLKIYYKI